MTTAGENYHFGGGSLDTYGKVRRLGGTWQQSCCGCEEFMISRAGFYVLTCIPHVAIVLCRATLDTA